MKKFILRLVSPIIAPLIQNLVKEAFKHALNEFFKRDEITCKVAVVSLYPVLDVPVARLAARTNTVIDDAVIEGLLTGEEDFAEANGISLQNLDND